MMHAVEMGSGAMIYISRFMISKVDKRIHRHTDRLEIA
jgi:hypothetical protein